ncbi:hypothetical protein R9C00_13800 [Flammeovirgaceae bacterium SG7u.111]|nr:hypothetical protein [Flammeovirgaceae bacterium SG7u.132]WPO38529.1 hypothetical protein R9C00_13800 [Flammeovirgaceae bacterium SG7u.111]
MSKKSITAKMEEMRKFIELTLSNTNELEVAVAAGFTKKEFEAKLSQYNQIVEKRQEYTFAFNRRKAATKALNGAKDALWEHYISLVGYARDIFEDDTEKYTFLSLEGERDKDYKEMKFQAFQFYTAILQNKPILNAFMKEKHKQNPY